MINTNELDSLLGANLNTNELSFSSFFNRIMEGNLTLSPGAILNEILRIIMSELSLHIGLMQQIIFICVLSAILKVLTDSFKSKGIGELGFYACYLSLVVIIFASFNVALEVASNMIQTITTILELAIPVIMALVIMTGNITAASAYNSLFIFAINIINFIIVNLLKPILIFSVTLSVINHLTEHEVLKNFSELLKKSLQFGVKTIVGLFISLMAIQRTAAPILNNIALRGARSAAGSVPIVGGALTGGIDSVVYLASGAKSAAIVATIIILIVVCAVPIIKLFVISFIYRFIAAIIAPICDKRIVKCLNAVGNFTGILLAISVAIVVMFAAGLFLIVSF
ncbi:MAG: stage III sporulation protein AE [Defluviitaleaceae bacterium]|nr:stage III sporulation protein AE [Defluviitaleaceae bacterium]